ncbi:hypothetical protein LJB90_01350 [Eubacteriales bacterium OttesenSCG-928-G02]|nr:hypothetical protein [Eubacteriales bacterium OttesenSCG-928-G02]
MQSYKKQLIKIITLLALVLCLIGITFFINSISGNDTSDLISTNSEKLTESLPYIDSSQPNTGNSGTSDSESFESSLESVSEETSKPANPITADKIPKEIFDQTITARYSILYCVETNEILYEKRAYDKCYPASITKLLTAAVAMDYLKDNDIIKVGKEVTLVGTGSSVAYLGAGQSLYFHTLMDALLLPSGNDAAYTMAVAAGRIALNNPNASVKEAMDCFVKKMNEKAKQIDCKNTNFTAPDGYHDWNHYTTAYDLAMISKYAMSFPLISQTVSKKESSVTLISGEYHLWKNSNILLGENYVTGLKTGTTNQSGPCLSASAAINGYNYIVIIIGASSSDARFNDAISIINTLAELD